MFKYLASLLTVSNPAGYDRLGNARSGRWPTVRAKHLENNPFCAACGRNQKLTVHHLKPFHLHPDLELDPANLLTLCESDVVNCHFFIGHLLDWKSFNSKAVEHAAMIHGAIIHRKLA